MWALHILIQELPAIQAERVQHAVTASVVPYLNQYDRQSLLRTLADACQPAITPERPSVEPDPEKAAAWFADQGVRVHHA